MTAIILAHDIAGLIATSARSAPTWSGTTGAPPSPTMTAMRHPESLHKLAILNVPHPERMLAGFRTLRQLRKSWYMFFFQIPGYPSACWRAMISRSPSARCARTRPVPFSDADLERYVQAWSQPGALTGMINYYRAALRRSPRAAAEAAGADPDADTGDLGRCATVTSAASWPSRCPSGCRTCAVERLPEATHWVQHDAPERVNELLLEFFRGDAAA